MKHLTRWAFRAVTFAIVVAGGLLVDENAVILQGGQVTSSAEARVGRPLTPVSYAGVARRTTRRAVAVGAAATVGTAAAVAATSRCVQAVDAYGRVYTRCY
jgi:hypothetical protein